MKRIATFVFAAAAALVSFQALAQLQVRPNAPAWLTRLYGVPGPKVNFGSCLAPVAAVSVTPSSLAFGSVAAPNVSPSQTVTVTNVGNNVLTIFGVNSIGEFESSTQFLITSDGCTSATLAPGGSCTIDVAYNANDNPTFVGPTSGVLSVSTSAPSGTSAVNMTATQIALATPQFDYLPPGGLDFGFVPQASTSAPMVVTIKNIGSAPMPTVSVAGPGDFAVISHTCGVVPPAGSCTANVVFSPTAPGQQFNSVAYSYTHPVFGTQFGFIPVTGFGLSPTADIFATPGSVNFGQLFVGDNVSSGVDVINSGSTPLTITSVNLPGPFIIFGNTCPVAPATLAPATTCNIAFQADTSLPATLSGTLTIGSDSVTNPSINVPVDAQVIPNFTFSPPSHFFPDTFTSPPGPSNSITVSLTNNDPIPEPVSFVSQIFGSDFAITDTCGGTVASGATCDFTITFQPSLQGGYFGPTIGVRDPGGSYSLDYSAIGIAIQSGPAATFTPGFLDFGSSVVGGPAPTLDVDFTNIGNATTVVSSVTSSAPEFSAVPLLGFCPPAYPIFAPGESCRLRVTFTLPATPLFVFGTLSVNDISGSIGSFQAAGFTTAAPTPSADYFPTSVNFGNVGVNITSAPVIVSFGNTGAAPFNITGPITVTGPFSIASTCPATLAPGDCCALTATYMPPPPGGPDSAFIDIPTDIGGATLIQIPLAGVGVPPPSFTVVPITLPNTRLGFTTGPVPFTLTNTGVTTVIVTAVTFSGPPEITPYDPALLPPPSPFAACIGQTLPPGGSCPTSFWFKPTAVGGYSGALIVTFTGGTGSPTVFAVVGQGVPATSPDIALSSDIIDFNGVVINTSATVRLGITSTGTAPLAIRAVTPLGPFSATQTCTAAPLPPGTGCFVDITFSTATLGNFTGDLVVEFDPPGSFRIVKLRATGIEVPRPRISLSAGVLAFGTQRVGTRGPDQSLLVKNIGSAPLSISRVQATEGFMPENHCATLSPGASCTVFVKFAPLGVGPIGGTLSIASNDPDRPTATANLSGTACRANSVTTSRNVAAGCGQ